MKRTPLWVLVALVLVAGFIFMPGCGQQEQPAEQQPTEETAVPAEPTPMEAEEPAAEEPTPMEAEKPAAEKAMEEAMEMAEAPMEMAKEAMEAMVPELEASAAALKEYLQQANYQETWKMWPGKSALYEGTEPHGVLLTTYVNDTAYEAIEGKQGMLPPGSLIVKENYGPDENLMALTIMYKVGGYNPDAGDWFWLKYLPDGTVEAEGKAEACIGCHAAKKDNDYIMTGALK
ncbi:MAG: hypothetical protein Kow0099_03400 [Candidatus Abyssubacteria bacterium]